jgi:hypothetical protein
MRMMVGIVLLVIAPGLAGCGHSPAPVAPLAPSPVPQAAPPSTAIQVTGWVSDSAFRPLAGASVEVLDGPQAGTVAVVDATGQFSLTGTFDDATRFRATKDGHVPTTGTLSPVCTNCSSSRRYIYFYMAVLAPPVDIAGDYTLTFIADSSCSSIPSELRTRTYAATITPGSNGHSPANTYFNAAVSGASFLADYQSFPIGVAGDLVAFELRGDGPYLVEALEPNTYIGFDGRAEASVATSAVSTISASFQGWIDYCALKSPMGQYYSCIPGQAVAHAECQSTNHRLILTRR